MPDQYEEKSMLNTTLHDFVKSNKHIKTMVDYSKLPLEQHNLVNKEKSSSDTL